MNAAEIMKAALCEAGHHRVAEWVQSRASRLAALHVPCDAYISEDEARAIQRARRLAYEACGIETDSLLTEDGYVASVKHAMGSKRPIWVATREGVMSVNDDWYEGHDGELCAFAYGTSRSGKTTYHSPVVLRDDLDAPSDELRMVQSFLFLPAGDDPDGELNRPHTVHRARVTPLDDIDWARWELSMPGIRERLEAWDERRKIATNTNS